MSACSQHSFSVSHFDAHGKLQIKIVHAVLWKVEQALLHLTSHGPFVINKEYEPDPTRTAFGKTLNFADNFDGFVESAIMCCSFELNGKVKDDRC